MNAIQILRRAVVIAGVLMPLAAAHAESPVTALLKQSFKPHGQATLARIDQDATQAACSIATPLSAAVAQKVLADNRALLQPPSDGQYLGDWKAGEKIAQTGTGMQYSDDPAKPAGGNCYACHQMADKEIAYGTIGPSLKQYGKLRGNSDAMLKYTWEKIYNADAYMPCSLMPRFGAQHILSEQQMRDVMAYLFAPASPVNQ